MDPLAVDTVLGHVGGLLLLECVERWAGMEEGKGRPAQVVGPLWPEEGSMAEEAGG